MATPEEELRLYLDGAPGSFPRPRRRDPRIVQVPDIQQRQVSDRSESEPAPSERPTQAVSLPPPAHAKQKDERESLFAGVSDFINRNDRRDNSGRKSFTDELIDFTNRNSTERVPVKLGEAGPQVVSDKASSRQDGGDGRGSAFSPSNNIPATVINRPDRRLPTGESFEADSRPTSTDATNTEQRDFTPRDQIPTRPKPEAPSAHTPHPDDTSIIHVEDMTEEERAEHFQGGVNFRRTDGATGVQDDLIPSSRRPFNLGKELPKEFAPSGPNYIRSSYDDPNAIDIIRGNFQGTGNRGAGGGFDHTVARPGGGGRYTEGAPLPSDLAMKNRIAAVNPKISQKERNEALQAAVALTPYDVEANKSLISEHAQIEDREKQDAHQKAISGRSSASDKQLADAKIFEAKMAAALANGTPLPENPTEIEAQENKQAEAQRLSPKNPSEFERLSGKQWNHLSPVEKAEWVKVNPGKFE